MFRRIGARRALAVAVALLLAGDVAGVAVVGRDTASTSTVASPKGPGREAGPVAKAPREWDPRVAKLASFVEGERELRFKNPVAVEFLAVDEYRKQIGRDAAKLSAAEKAEIETFNGQARALGLIPKGADVFEATNQIVDEGTLAFYDPERKRMVVRGTEITVGVQVTVVHELTHALQDQHFDLTREFPTDGGDGFFHALIEGDAVRVDQSYVQKLSGPDQRKYFSEQSRESATASDGLKSVPPALIQLFSAPYSLGAPMTTVVVEDGGIAPLDALFRKPPASDEGMLNAFALLDDDAPKKVGRPKLKASEKKTDSGDFGSVAWYIVLASFIDARTALRATDGWGGDAYVGYTKAGRACLRIAYVGDTAKDADELSAALNTWKKAFPPERVSVVRTAAGVEFDVCEPDVIPTPITGADSSLELPAARLGLVAEVLSQGATLDAARCFTNEFIERVDLNKLSPETEADQKALMDLGFAIGQKCRAAA